MNTTLLTYVSAGGLQVIKHVVLLEPHKSHLFNSSYMQYMQANNIEVCFFPPHCTYIHQPLDDIPYVLCWQWVSNMTE